MFSRAVRNNPRLRALLASHHNRLWNASSHNISLSAACLNTRKVEDFTKDQKKFVVFPEISIDSSCENEFYKIPQNGQIPFDKITAEKVVKASGKLSIELEHFIDDLSTSLRREFADQDVSNAKLNEFISEMEKHLLPLNYTLNLLNSFRTIRPDEFDFRSFDEFFHARYSKSKLRFTDRQIYCYMCEMKARREFFQDDKNPEAKENADFEQQQKNQIVDRYIREAKLQGQSLKHQDQMAVFRLINEKLTQEQGKFLSKTIEEATRFKMNIISPQFLDCLPDHVITNLNHNDAPSVFQSFMRYCPDQNLRKDFWFSYHGLASPFMGADSNNLRSIEAIRDLRYRKARILGYDNFAQMAVDLRAAGGQTMAGSVENVEAFINGLNVRSQKKFDENFKELEDFATNKPKKAVKIAPKHFVEKVNLWDWKYFERLYLRQLYGVDSIQVRAHFPLNRVFTGMLKCAENLFGLKIVEQKDDQGKPMGWGPNTKLFKIFSNNSKSMAELGSFYFDPFQSVVRIFMPISRCDSMGTKPLAFFLMNYKSGASIFDQFEKSQQLRASDKESLLNFYQIIELFEKFGFILRHILTEVKYSEINSLYNVEADAFDLVNEFMKLWPLNSYEVIKNCSGHVETGQVIPQELYERMRKAYYHFASINLKNDLRLMALDLKLHSTKEPANAVEQAVWNELMAPFEWPSQSGELCATNDIFSGNGFESVLYSKKWSEVIAADIFDAFRGDTETGLKSDEQIKQLGERFRETFLAHGGAVSTNELFRRFRGRDPTLDGYLSINQLD